MLSNRKKKTVRTSPIRVVIAVALAFGFLFFVEFYRKDPSDYDEATIRQLEKEGYVILREHIEKKTPPPKQLDVDSRKGDIETLKNTPGNNEPRGQAWKSPMDIFGNDAELKIYPILGKHRSEQDAVFAFARGASFRALVRFIGSLLRTGYKGDIVIAIDQKNDMKPETAEYLQYHAKHKNVVVYAAELTCKTTKLRIRCKVYKMFLHKEIGGYLPDARPNREIGMIRFEYYWAWSQQYTSKVRIFLLDAEDTWFQEDPFPKLQPNMATTLITFQESSETSIGDDADNRLYLREGHERRYLHRLGKEVVLTSGATVGGQPAIETYTRAMVQQSDDSGCTIYGCEQGHHNFLFHGNFLVGSPSIEKIEIGKFGESLVMSLALQVLHGQPLRRKGFVVGASDEVLLATGLKAPIVHEFDKDDEVQRGIEGRKTTALLRDWEEVKKRKA